MNQGHFGKRIFIADPRDPERMVLSSILGRLGYEISSFSNMDDFLEALTEQPRLVVMHAQLEGAADRALSLGSAECRVILVDLPPESSHAFSGFVDATEHVLRGINVRVPEIVMVINDFISPPEGMIRRPPRVAGGYATEIHLRDQVMMGHIYNISVTGAFLEIANPPERDETMLLKFQLPHTGEMFQCEGLSTWRVLPSESAAMRSPPGCGVRFLNLTADQSSLLDDFVERKGRLEP
ncbi:MAG: hypothetical protein CVU59_02315 [Deltaproteobacteria bacterium HGW-Deltaproteobacteria-17]|jgi:hypothetical protein|nr:MAG: hypothetical protein CVU59_02315 [Deltaproteobacteria bacterium HGW-Deltaproteobacteria-17]